jgi:hypothetical protein
MTRRKIHLGVVQRLGPVVRVERQHRSERNGRELSPPQLLEELGQRLAQELHVQISRRIHLPLGLQPLGELGIQLLAPGESRFLEMGGSLDPGVALQGRAELVNYPPAEPKTCRS